MNETSTSVKILDRDYPLKLSANAMAKIKKQYGGLARAGDALAGNDDVGDKIEVSIGLLSILATEGARAYNFAHPDEPKLPDLPPEVVGTVLTLAEIDEMAPQIARAINEGMKRNIISEDDGKNTVGAE